MRKVTCGIDSVESARSILTGRRLGLMTNPTGINDTFERTADILRAQFQLTALFAVEHGIDGSRAPGESFGSYQDPWTGLTVWSLYTGNHRLTGEMLDTFDVFCFDMQDVGARFYTYLYALSFAMEECAKAGKPVVVFDRINPLGGDRIEGPVLDERLASYVGMYALPTRYGLTIGEYALWVRDHLKLNLELHVVPLTGWRRSDEPESLGIPWVAPSPNCASLHTARAYIGTCVFEGTNISEGRGTTMPFEYIGAPWIDAWKLEERMRRRAAQLPGLYFRANWFVPSASKYAGKTCAGVQMHITDRTRANAVFGALALMDEIREMHPDCFEWLPREQGGCTVDLLVGTEDYRRGIYDAEGLLEAHAPLRERFREERRPFLLYE